MLRARFFCSLILTIAAISLVGCTKDDLVNLGGDAAVPTPDSGLPSDAGAPDAGVEPGVAVLSADSLDFGRVVVGTTASRTLTLSNPGPIPVRASVSVPSGRNAELFVRRIGVADEGGAFEIAPGANVEVAVEVTPLAEGTVIAALTVQACAGGCATSVALVAGGVATGIQCDTRLEFGTANPGRCFTQTATCANSGNVTERIATAELDPSSNPAFTATPPALPVELAPVATTFVRLEFCPTAVGDAVGALLVRTDSPGAFEHRVELVGRGGGSDIECGPALLDFGLVGLNAPEHRNLTCRNVGPEPGAILSAMLSGAGFMLAGGAVPIPVGGSVDLEVIAMGSSPALLTGSVTITTDDPHDPTLTVALAAEVVSLAPCNVRFVPGAKNFGLVPTGSRQSASVSLSNAGASECVVREVALLPGSSPDFTLSGVPAGGVTLAGGASLDLSVTFTPAGAATSTGAIGANFTNPMSPPIQATLSGEAGATRIALEPAALDFGRVPVGCAAPTTRTVQIRRIGGPVQLLQITLVTSSSTSFVLGPLPNLPVGLAQFQSVPVNVSFAPDALGPHAAELHVTIAGQSSPTVLPIRGEGAATAARSETFVYRGQPVDLLFVIDDSCSMAGGQAGLAAVLPGFAADLVASGADLQVGFVTTDMTNPALQGRLQGTPPVLVPSNPSFETELALRAVPGTGGSGTEQGVAAAIAALTPPLSVMENAGFLRTGSHVAIVLVSDEEDVSQGLGMQEAAAALLGAAGPGGLSVYALVGPATGNCTGPHGGAQQADRFAELVARVGRGALLPYCSAFEPSFGLIAAELFGEATFTLDDSPLPGTVVVRVAGAVVPATDPNGVRNWSFDSVNNRVVFAAGRSPAAGTSVTIEYDGFCLSPTCGNSQTEPFEQCDDGNPADDDACVVGCRLASCGDGFRWTGMEECDDANSDQTDACLVGCLAASCGDGFLQSGVEDCDDGNNVSGDGCPASCVLETDVRSYYTVAGLTAAAYAPIAGETPITFGGGGDDGVGTVALPFTFELFGVVTSTLSVSPNGFVTPDPLVAPVGADNRLFPDPAEPDGIIAVWWDDFTIDTQVTGGASVGWVVQGTAPNRTMVIQWRNVRVAAHSTNNHRRFNFQLALFETTNVIELRYGETLTSGGVPTATNASVGIENQDATAGEELLGCSPGCSGPARPQNPNGFPRQSMFRLTPL